MLEQEKFTKLELAMGAMEDSAAMREVRHICAKGIFSGENRIGAMSYREGSAGVLAGALAGYHRDFGPDNWRTWLPAARVLLSWYTDETEKEK